MTIYHKFIALILFFCFIIPAISSNSIISAKGSELSTENVISIYTSVLTSLQIKTSREEVSKCAYNLKDPTVLIESFIKHFSLINWEHLPDIYQGCLQIIELALNIFTDEFPCFYNNAEYNKLKAKFENVEFISVFRKIISNGPAIFQHSRELVEDWEDNDFDDFGIILAEIIKFIMPNFD